MTLQPDPVEAEATGQQYVVATYAGRDYKLSLDAETWPLDLIAISVGIGSDQKLVANDVPLTQAMVQLLGDQWDDFSRAFPRRRHLIPASQVFAAAAGFAGEPRDLAFGALPRLLATLTHWGAAVEATLGDLGLDYRDRWRFDADGQRKLTLRQIHVRLSHVRHDSPLAIATNGGRVPHTSNDLLLMDLFEAITKVAHPSRPLTAAQRAERTNEQKKKNTVNDAVADYESRMKSRKQKAVETARANAQRGKGTAAHGHPQQEDQAQFEDGPEYA